MKQNIGTPVNINIPYPLLNSETLQGQYVNLVRLTPNHIDSLYDCFEKVGDDSWTYLSYGPFDTKENFANFINDFCLGHDPYFYCIQNKKINKY